MNFFKKYKLTIIVIGIFIILVILAFNVYNLLVPNSNSAIYGNRLDGLNNVKVSQEVYSNIVKTLEEESYVTKASTDERGRLINVLITVTDDTALETAKGLGAKVLTSFSEEQIAYYDFQVIICKSDENQKAFPIIGYKHRLSEGFSFTKDRVNE